MRDIGYIYIFMATLLIILTLLSWFSLGFKNREINLIVIKSRLKNRNWKKFLQIYFVILAFCLFAFLTNGPDGKAHWFDVIMAPTLICYIVLLKSTLDRDTIPYERALVEEYYEKNKKRMDRDKKLKSLLK
jgi:hypothetical protein